VISFPNGDRGQRDTPFTPIPRAVVWGERVALTNAASYTIDVYLWVLRDEPFAATERHWDVFAP
jgi:hypothetical protein